MPELDRPPHNLPHLIEVVDRYEVGYMLVGGAAAYAYGATIPTEDADYVVRREWANLDRLTGALHEPHARLPVGRMSDEAHLAAPDRRDDTRPGWYVRG
jgi:hypothetical protein